MPLDQTKLKTALSKLETEGDSRYSEGIVLGLMAGIIACENYTLEEAWLLVKNLLPKEWTQVQKQIEFNLRRTNGSNMGRESGIMQHLLQGISTEGR